MRTPPRSAIPALVLAVSAAASACASEPSATAPTVGQDQLRGMVITVHDMAPLLCSEVLDSFPPQCGAGVVLAGWDWSAVEGEERSNGTVWGSFVVTGRYVDGGFAVTGAAPA